MELLGKVALVTGAGSGIGKSAALRLAKEGARIGVLSDTKSEVKQTADEIRKRGGEALSLHADVGDAHAMRRATGALVRTYGRLDIAVANAGIGGIMAPIDEIEPGEWDQTINTNLRGTFLTLHYAVPHLKQAGAGAIVIVSSINGTRSFSDPGSTAYSCSKAAQFAMALMAARELAKHRIRVNVICPGSITTNIDDNTFSRHVGRADIPVEYPEGQIPLTGDEPGTPDDVAELILFLVSNRSKHITGTPVWIDGGQSLMVG